MKVVVSRAAERDLDGVEAEIARFSPRRARTYLDELLDACERIGAAPLGYPLLPGHEEAGYRRSVHGNYLLVFRLRNDRVEIVRVLHGARDIERILGG